MIRSETYRSETCDCGIKVTYETDFGEFCGITKVEVTRHCGEHEQTSN